MNTTKTILGAFAATMILSGAAVAQSSTTTTTTTTGGATTSTTEQFFVVRDPATRRCTVVTERPASGPTVVVGDTVFKSRTEAESSVTRICQ